MTNKDYTVLKLIWRRCEDGLPPLPDYLMKELSSDEIRDAVLCLIPGDRAPEDQGSFLLELDSPNVLRTSTIEEVYDFFVMCHKISKMKSSDSTLRVVVSHKEYIDLRSRRWEGEDR